MALVVDGREYELLRASSGEDMTLELSLIGAPTGPVARVYYRDADGAMTFSAFERDIAFELIEVLVRNAREALTPLAKKDGTDEAR